MTKVANGSGNYNRKNRFSLIGSDGIDSYGYDLTKSTYDLITPFNLEKKPESIGIFDKLELEDRPKKTMDMNLLNKYGKMPKPNHVNMGSLSSTGTDSQGTYQKPSKEYWKKFKAVGSKGWSGVKSAGSGIRQGYKDYNKDKPKARTGIGKIWQGFGNVVDSAVSLASVPLNLVGYTTRGLVDGTNRALEGGQYAVEHTGGTVGELGRGIGAALHRGSRWGREKAEGNLLEEIVRRDAKHKPSIMHYPRNPYQLNLIALMFLLASFISFTFSSSTTGSVVGAFSQTSMLPTFLGIVFLAASFALFQIKRKR